MGERLTHDHFLPFVGGRFSFDGQDLELVLRSVDQAPDALAEESGRTPFVLVFAGPRGEVLPEGLYRAAAPDGTGFMLYINPIHTVARDRQDYQAVFN